MRQAPRGGYQQSSMPDIGQMNMASEEQLQFSGAAAGGNRDLSQELQGGMAMSSSGYQSFVEI